MVGSSRRAAAYGLGLVLVLGIAGCGTDEPAGTPAKATPSATSSTTPQAAADAPTAALRAFQAWAQPELPYKAWWAGLRPLLSTAGQAAYASTDPAEIPRLKVTGAAVETDRERTAFTRLVEIPTDQGQFGLVLSRGENGTGPWLLLRIYFPEGLH